MPEQIPDMMVSDITHSPLSGGNIRCDEKILWDSMMSNPDFEALTSVHEFSSLLKSTKPTALRTASLAGLRLLSQKLAYACEVSRKSALRKMAERKCSAPDLSDRTQNFSVLFAALRRVRAELRRRGEL